MYAQGKLNEAVVCLEKALEIKPDFAAAHCNLGSVLRHLGQLDGMIECIRRALHINPDLAEAHGNLGDALKNQGKLGEAVASYQRAVWINPNYAEAHVNLSVALTEQGQLGEAVASYRRALQINPNYPKAHSNLLLTRQYQPGVSLAALATEHAEWDRRHAQPNKVSWHSFAHTMDPQRKLRLGFVSADLGRHPVCFSW